jgi:hypothetical protein
LTAWIAAIGLAAAAWSCAWFAAAEAGMQVDSPFTEFNRARIAAFGARGAPAGVRRVILLGSSALKYATRDDAEFAQGVANAVGAPVETLRITSNWGSFYEFAPLAADILRVRPDLVVMESEFLATDRPPARRFILWLRHARRGLGLDVPDDEPGISEADVQFAYPCWRRKLPWSHARLLALRADWVEIRPGGPGPRAAQQFAEQLLAQGAEVAFLSIPRRPDYEDESRRTREVAYDGPPGRALSGRALRWERAPMPTGLYCDLTHLTPAGQAQYSTWLETTIAGLFSDRSS